VRSVKAEERSRSKELETVAAMNGELLERPRARAGSLLQAEPRGREANGERIRAVP